MAKAHFKGPIANAIADELRKKSKEQLIQLFIDDQITRGKDFGDRTKRKQAGGIKKNEKYEPFKVKTRAVHAEVKHTFGNRPTPKLCSLILTARYPKDVWPMQRRKGVENTAEGDMWSNETVMDWLERLNRGEPI